MNVEQCMYVALDGVLRTPYVSIIREWRALQWLTPSELHEIQRHSLNAMLQHAVSNIPYYQSMHAKSSKIPPSIEEYPILTKSLLHTIKDAMIWNKRGQLVEERSSGSSGIQAVVQMSRQEHVRSMALQTFLWEWSGYYLGAPLMQTGMALPRSTLKRFKDAFLRTLYVSAFDLGNDDIDETLREVRRRGIKFVGGYASSLNQFAARAIENGVRLPMHGVISWGDKMFPHYRSRVEEAFQARVTDVYGATEGFVIAGQCEHGSYHVLTPHVYLEIVDDSYEPVPNGVIGKVLVTRLDAFRMPLIRYEIGDMAAYPEHDLPCPCGRGLPQMQSFIGRETDVIVTPNGRRMIVHFFTAIFEHIPEIQQFQVLQAVSDSITIRFVPRESFTERTLDSIRDIIIKRLGEPITILFERAADIPPSPSGKPQIVISRIAAS